MASPKTKISDDVAEPLMVAESAPNETTAPETVMLEQIDDVFKELKTLLTTVEKLQNAREEVRHMKPLLLRLLDGELLSGDELEQLKAGIGSLSKLVKLYSDYQTVLENAQPARILLDKMLKA